MELRHLRYFVMVAEESNFGRAAVRLQMTQPSLSRQIHDLEGELGTDLLVRQPRQLLLTPAGKVFLEKAQKLLQDAEEAVALAQKAGRGEVGQLTIGYNSDQTGCGWLPAILQHFRASYPAVKLGLAPMNTARQVEALHNEEIDLGFSIRVGSEKFEAEKPGISWCNFISEPLVAVLPPRHVLAGHDRVSLDDLSNQPFVGASMQLNPLTGDYTPTLYEEAGFKPIRYLGCDAPRRTPEIKLVSDGQGVSLAPLHEQNNPAIQGVIYRPLAENLLANHTLLWRAADTSAVLAAFLKLSKEEIKRDYTAFAAM